KAFMLPFIISIACASFYLLLDIRRLPAYLFRFSKTIKRDHVCVKLRIHHDFRIPRNPSQNHHPSRSPTNPFQSLLTIIRGNAEK
ncbi:MAG: hypothetical protein KKE96_04210, partial [Candidatus Altiarchaeota archaeon]|nr:hypothetical protein [Candidatus Altiarchaeota archaeon]